MLAADLTIVARHRQCESAKLTNSIRGDLDWIVMKALEKDRTRRYDTANGLATDIARHLNNEPVVARPPTNLYRFQKLVRRNKLAFAAASAVLAALILGLGVSTWMFFKEKHARQRAVAAEKNANAEASKSQQVAQFLKDMLKGVGPSVALGRDTTMLREILDKTAERVSKDLTNQPDVQVELRDTLTGIYRELGLYKQMEEMARETLRLSRARLGEEHRAVADALGQLGEAMARLGNLDQAETMHREALAMRRKLLGNEHTDVAGSLNRLANVLHDQGKLAEAEAVYREALVMRRKLLGNEHNEVAGSLDSLASVLRDQGKLAEAESRHREALAMTKKLLGNEHPDVAMTLNNLAIVLEKQSKLAEAETMHREVLAMWRKLLGNEHPDVAGSLNNLANVLRGQGKLAEAETMHREALAMWRKLLGNEHPRVATSLYNLATVLGRQGNLAEAETMHREALVMWKKLGNERPHVALSLNNLANVLRDQGNLPEAETMYREALAMRRKLLGNEHPDVATSLRDLEEVLYRQAKYAEAEPLYREHLQSKPTLGDATDDKDVGTSASLGRLLADWAWAERSRSAGFSPLRPGDGSAVKRTEVRAPHEMAREAERLLRDCLAIRLRGTNSTHWRVDDVRCRLGGALLSMAVTDAALTAEARQTKLNEAESLLLEGNEALQRSKSADRKYKRDALERLVHLYEAWDELAPNTGKSTQAAKWKTKLADFDSAEIQKKAVAPKPQPPR
jgi:tetratricopeptide (TPR) repeat protein